MSTVGMQAQLERAEAARDAFESRAKVAEFQRDTHSRIAQSLQARIRDMHTQICGDDEGMGSPDEHHAAILAEVARLRAMSCPLCKSRETAWDDTSPLPCVDCGKMTCVCMDDPQPAPVVTTPDIVGQCIDDAVVEFGGQDDGMFNAAGFGSSFAKRMGLSNALDGNIVRGILSGRPDVEFTTPGDAHYRRIR